MFCAEADHAQHKDLNRYPSHQSIIARPGSLLATTMSRVSAPSLSNRTIAADKSVVPRKHTKTEEKQRSLKSSSRKPVGVIVRRGAQRRFDSLTKKTAGLPVVVSWDRRQGDRRASPQPFEDTDQRKTDRRQKPPFTWEVADFVVSDCAPHESGFTRRIARKTKRRTSKKEGA